MMRRVLFFRAALTLLLALGIATAAGAATKTFVKNVMLIGGSKSETDDLKATYTSQGWIVINKDLNAGAGGDYIYLLYKADSDYDNNTSYVSDFFLWRADDTFVSMKNCTLTSRMSLPVSSAGQASTAL